MLLFLPCPFYAALVAHCHTPFLTCYPAPLIRSHKHDPDDTVMSANATMVVEEEDEEEEAAEDPDQDASIEDGAGGRPRRRALSARRAFALSGGASSEPRRKVTLPTATVLFSPGCASATVAITEQAFRIASSVCYLLQRPRTYPLRIFAGRARASASPCGAAAPLSPP
jgi:hypothetical protein